MLGDQDAIKTVYHQVISIFVYKLNEWLPVILLFVLCVCTYVCVCNNLLYEFFSSPSACLPYISLVVCLLFIEYKNYFNILTFTVRY